jgi:hypothetical protein
MGGGVVAGADGGGGYAVGGGQGDAVERGVVL